MTGKSKSMIRFCTFTVFKAADAPSTINRLNILEPTTLPTAIALEPDMPAVIPVSYTHLKEEMVSHHFINNDWKQQETLFADGTRVIVDFNTQSYKIERS